MTTDQNLQGRAARLLALMAISRARRALIPSINPQTPARRQTMPYREPEPTNEVKTIAADLLQSIALGANGTPFDSSTPEGLDQLLDAEAEGHAQPEIVSHGSLRFRVIDGDPVELAVACGAIEEGAPPSLALLVEFADDEGAPHPSTGQYLNVATDEPGVSILFRIWITSADLHDPGAPDLGPGAVRNEALAAIDDHPRRGLIVQVIGEADDEESAQ
ncbi:hypothetical protein ACSFA7_22570 [Variovorax sp. LT1R20]|uniref:hypothetical protein n=1 Tax=Variovorax sp. LT1R20 TaxID=3443729 RepID=UPI003F45B41D